MPEQGRRTPRTKRALPGKKQHEAITAIWLLWANGRFETEPVGDKHHKYASALEERVGLIVWHEHFPRAEFERRLARLPRGLVLIAFKGPRGFRTKDIGGLLVKWIERKGELLEDGLVHGTAWLVQGPSGSEVAEWLNNLPERYTNRLKRSSDAEQTRQQTPPKGFVPSPKQEPTQSPRRPGAGSETSEPRQGEELVAPKSFLTVSQAAEVLQLEESVVRRHCLKGNLQATKFGSAWMITWDAIEEFRVRYPDDRTKPGPKVSGQ